MLVSKFLLENCDSRVSTGKFGWTFCVLSHASSGGISGFFASGCLIKDRRIQLKKPFLLTGAEGEFASSLLCRKCPKKWDFSPFSVLLSKLSCPACLSKLNDSNLLTSQRDSSTSFPPLRHFLHHPHPPGSESRFETIPGNLPKKEALKKTSRYIVTLFSPEFFSGSISLFFVFFLGEDFSQQLAAGRSDRNLAG